MKVPAKSRRTERKTVAMAATFRTAGGLRAQVGIADISANGCCLTARAMRVKVGSCIVIRPEGMEGLFATVRWITGDRIGVEFDAPLYEPVVDHLAMRYADDRTINVSYT